MRTRESEEKVASKPRKESRRRKRGVHGRGRLKLAVPKIEGYYSRWVTDVGNRITDFTQDDDYEFVARSEIDDQVGESGNGNTDLGSRVRVLVDKDETGPIYQYLLKKPQAFHDEDLKEKEAIRQDKEQALRRGNDQIERQYGDIKSS